MEITVYSVKGNKRASVQINEGSYAKYELMKEDYIILKFSSDKNILFHLGDYVDLRDLNSQLFDGVLSDRYELISVYAPVFNNDTGGYDYDFRLDAYYWKWKNKIFKYIPENVGAESSWVLTANLGIHLEVFLSNLRFLGTSYSQINGTEFHVMIQDSVDKVTAISIEYQNTKLTDALNKMAESLKCEWWVSGNTIWFGRLYDEDNPISVGSGEYGNEAVSIDRSDSSESFATRLYCFGGDRNVPSFYGRKLEFEISELHEGGVYLLVRDKNRSMLPKFFYNDNVDEFEYIEVYDININDSLYTGLSVVGYAVDYDDRRAAKNLAFDIKYGTHNTTIQINNTADISNRMLYIVGRYNEIKWTGMPKTRSYWRFNLSGLVFEIKCFGNYTSFGKVYIYANIEFSFIDGASGTEVKEKIKELVGSNESRVETYNLRLKTLEIDMTRFNRSYPVKCTLYFSIEIKELELVSYAGSDGGEAHFSVKLLPGTIPNYAQTSLSIKTSLAKMDICFNCNGEYICVPAELNHYRTELNKKYNEGTYDDADYIAVNKYDLNNKIEEVFGEFEEYTDYIHIGDKFTLNDVSLAEVPLNYFTDKYTNSITKSGLVQRRLALPDGVPYIDVYEDMAEEEAIEDTVIFEDVYPKQECSIVKVVYETKTLKDENGYDYDEYRLYTIVVDLGFPMKQDYILEGKDLQILFQDGSLNGYDFTVNWKQNASDNEEYKDILKEHPTYAVLEILREEKNSIYLPNNELFPTVGQKFILLNFYARAAFSDGIIQSAEQELLKKSEEEAEKRRRNEATYTVRANPVWAHEEGCLSPGQSVILKNPFSPYNQDTKRKTRVLGYTLKLDIPYDDAVYTLGDSAAYSRIGNLESEVKTLNKNKL